MISFTFPMPPQLANARAHWRVISKRKKQYRALLDTHQSLGLIPPPPAEPWPKVEVEAHLFLWNPMDQGNSINRLKWLEDWLVTRGYFKDDRAKNLKWRGLPEQTVTRSKKKEGGGFEWTNGEPRVEMSVFVV